MKFFVLLACLVVAATTTRARAECSAEAFDDLTTFADECPMPADLAAETWVREVQQPHPTRDRYLAFRRGIQDDTSMPSAWRAWMSARFAASLDAGVGPASFDHATTVPEECVLVTGRTDGHRLCVRLTSIPESSDGHLPSEDYDEVQVLDFEQARRAFWYVKIAADAFTAGDADARRAAHRAIRSARDTWDRLYGRGYFQFPWELAVNGAIHVRHRGRGAFDVDHLRPLRNQLVLLHPLVAVGFHGLGGASNVQPSARAVTVLALELVGVAHYAKSFSRYYGASLTLGVDSLDFAEPRIGAAFHVTRFVTVGYAVSVGRTTRGDGTAFVGVDVFGAARRILSLGGTDLEDPT